MKRIHLTLAFCFILFSLKAQLIRGSIKSQNGEPLAFASIFVNPLQFGKNEDFSNYPKTLSQDVELLEKLGCNYLFLPEPNFAKNLDPIIPRFSDVLCGLSRPTHFQGVITIIDKFLSVLKPNACLLGLKDYQQHLGRYWRSNFWLMKNHLTGKSTELHSTDWKFKNGFTDRDFNKNTLSRVK